MSPHDPSESDAPLFDVLIVGGGPAGLSAALVLGRCRRSVLVADAGEGRNAMAEASHGFLTRDGVAPGSLRAAARAQLAPYNVRVVGMMVRGARPLGGQRGFEATLEGPDGLQAVRARRLLLATGMRDVLPDLPGFAEIYGQSAHHCPYCDGYEWRDRPLAVLAPEQGEEYALTLGGWSRDLILFTDGGPAPKGAKAAQLQREGVSVITDRLAGLRQRDGRLEAVVLHGGREVPREALFFHLGAEPSSDLPQRLGCRLNRDGEVLVDAGGRTSARGVYAAGDLTPGPDSIVSAAAQGSSAAAAIQQDLRQSELR